jgi:uncharacterized membrane protein YeaQ/YmgE (transglycosylase-associated protein family)
MIALASWAVFGAILGVAARWVVPGAPYGGALGDVLAGAAGAVAAGGICGLLGRGGGLPSVGSFAGALIGAVLLLWLVRSIAARRAA